jgi:hypothetical protein
LIGRLGFASAQPRRGRFIGWSCLRSAGLTLPRQREFVSTPVRIRLGLRIAARPQNVRRGKFSRRRDPAIKPSPSCNSM